MPRTRSQTMDKMEDCMNNIQKQVHQNKLILRNIERQVDAYGWQCFLIFFIIGLIVGVVFANGFTEEFNKPVKLCFNENGDRIRCKGVVY